MNILLIDIDSKIPNLALMKLATYHKAKGNTVTLQQLNLSGYPKKKNPVVVDTTPYDLTYASCIFTCNRNVVKFKGKYPPIIGGTGFDLTIKLPKEIDDLPEDYEIYPDNQISYGFITRGCIRHCSFCFVYPKEGKLHLYRHPKDIIKFPNTEFLDNNFLAYEKHKEILAYLVENKVKCNFNQGLDFRFLNEENSELLSKLKYQGEYIFAFDNISYEQELSKKLNIFQKFVNKPWKIKLFILVGYNSTIKEDLYRINWCLSRKILPYVMRHENCYIKENKDFYTDLAAYANQPNIVKKLPWKDYLDKRHLSTKEETRERIRTNLKLYNENV